MTPQIVNKRHFCRQMLGVLVMSPVETAATAAAPDVAENDGPLCRLTLARIVFYSWRTSVSSPLSHRSDLVASSSRPRSEKQLGVSGT